MKRGINKVIILGHVGQDPELRYMSSGTPTLSLTVATSESWKDKNSGEYKESTEWHRVVFFDKLAEIASGLASKGSKVYVEGRLKTRSWEQNGQKKYVTEIIASEFQALDSRTKSAGTDDVDFSYEVDPSLGRQTRTDTPAQTTADFDDDIPF